jgi:hypothetical protein
VSATGVEATAAAGVDGAGPGDGARPALLCLAQSFAPDTTPTAIRASKLLAKLSARWDVTVLTEAPREARDERVRVEVVASKRPRRLFSLLRRLRLNKLIELLVWPDESIFWVLPAIAAGRRQIARRRPDAIVVFMMPYSTGMAGIALGRMTGVPLILNLDDSLTCTDMHPRYPTRLHYRLAVALEDLYARSADAVVYVSQTNLDAVAARQDERTRERLRLVRYGADASDDFHPRPPRSEDFEIAYVGAMSGWWAVIGERAAQNPAKRLYSAWTELGRYERTVLDHRTSSPVFAGQAILRAIDEHPDLAGRLRLTVYGNPYDRSVVARALDGAGVESVVTVLDPIPHAEVADVICAADLLFVTLPKRTDGTPGGRISAKTYEYLMTDRPILAAVPRGENWDYLADKPGVWLVEPDDVPAMQDVIASLAQEKLAGRPRAFDRGALREEMSYDARARQFDEVIRAGVSRRSGAG